MRLRIVHLILLFLVCTIIHAKKYSVSSLPALNDRETYVSNPDNILSAATVDSLNRMLLHLDRHKVQCLVVCVKNIENDVPYEFAIGLGRRFGVGGKQNLGIVVVLATEDRSYQITTGRGMEKYLPDVICQRIGSQMMMPFLGNENWDEALLAAVRGITGYLDQESEIVDQLRENANEDNEFGREFMITLIFVILGISILTIFNEYRKTRCPHCHKHKLKIVSRYTRTDKNGDKHLYRVFICQHCHHQITRETIVRKHNDRDSGGFIFFGGPGGGYFGGSSGGFGGFGGGSFGGGGAGGRF